MGTTKVFAKYPDEAKKSFKKSHPDKVIDKVKRPTRGSKGQYLPDPGTGRNRRGANYIVTWHNRKKK